MFPETRMRRLRATANIRCLNTEIRLNVDDLIYPLFVVEGDGIRDEISSMPGVYHLSLDMLILEVKEAIRLGIKAVMLFGIPNLKDPGGSEAYAENGIIQRAIQTLKTQFPNLVVSTDVCLCEYTDHGHCGLIKDGDVQNDPTLKLLAKIALSHAKAGADILAPSDMMDGRIGVMRRALDDGGYTQVAIMAHSVKYASAFYGPFREAAGSAPAFGDRKTYQMDPASGVRQALAETALDVAEGADYVIVKPALAYMDIIAAVRSEVNQPVVSYNVSGEYAMVKAAALNGWIDEKKTVLELLIGLKRAGSNLIITYHAMDVAKWLAEDKG